MSTLVPGLARVERCIGRHISPALPVIRSLFNLVPADAHFPEVLLDHSFPVLSLSTWPPPKTRPGHFTVWIEQGLSSVLQLELYFFPSFYLCQRGYVLPGSCLSAFFVERSGDNDFVKRCMTWEVEGIRQKKTWWACVKNDTESLRLSQKDAQFKNKWRRRIN